MCCNLFAFQNIKKSLYGLVQEKEETPPGPDDDAENVALVCSVRLA
jgi:hypothetical protein